MFARVSTIQGSPDQAEKAIGGLVLPEVQEVAGFKGAYALLDRKSGKVMLITLWETEEAMQSTAESANQLRREIAKDAGATAPPMVEVYEVVRQP